MSLQLARLRQGFRRFRNCGSRSVGDGGALRLGHQLGKRAGRAGVDHHPALRRQLRDRQPRLARPGFRRRCIGVWYDLWFRGGDRCRPAEIGDPLIDFFSAAVVGGARYLRLAQVAAFRTGDADMHVVVVPVIRLDLAQVRPIDARLQAERLLDPRMHEHALHLRIGGRAHDQAGMCRRPNFGVDEDIVGPQHRSRGQILALLGGQPMVGHGRQPDIGVEADLMTGVPREHGTTARLRHVADEQARPTVVGFGVICQTFDQLDEIGVAPVPVARQAHHLPVRAVDRQWRGASKATMRIKTDHLRCQGGRRAECAKNRPGLDDRRCGGCRFFSNGLRLWQSSRGLGSRRDGCGLLRRCIRRQRSCKQRKLCGD